VVTGNGAAVKEGGPKKEGRGTMTKREFRGDLCSRKVGYLLIADAMICTRWAGEAREGGFWGKQGGR